MYFSGKNTRLLHCKEAKGKSLECTSQDNGFMFNGIYTLDNHIFAADTISSLVKVYEIKKDFSLKLVESVKFSHHLDNIVKHTDGSFLVSGFKKNIEVLEHAENIKVGHKRSVIAGAVSIMSKENGNWTVEELIVQDKIFASVAIIMENQLIIGSPTDSYLLICPVNT